MKEIKLTQNKIALIDDEDFWFIKRYNWSANEHPMKDRSLWYAQTAIRLCGRQTKLSMHRLIMDAKKGQMVDHVNHSGLDNRKANLRFCTRAQNAFNRIGYTALGYKGVSFHRQYKKYQVQHTLDGRHVFVGFFDSLIDAAKAYDNAVREAHGEFAVLNFPVEAT